MPYPVKSPASIKHVNFSKTDNLPSLALKASKACHMGRGEAAYLMYLASCSNGFAPSAKLVAEKIGCSTNRVYNLRDLLRIKGIITIADDTIFVRWDRIRIFASLDPNKTSKEFWTKPQCAVAVDRLGNLLKMHPTLQETYEMSLDELIIELGRMTEVYYRAWRAEINRDIKRFGLNRVTFTFRTVAP